MASSAPISKGRLAALVIVPAVVLLAGGVATAVFLGLAAGFAAMVGSLRTSEAAWIVGVGGTLTVGAFITVLYVMERRVRPVSPWKTRAASVGLVLTIVILTSPVSKEFEFQQNLRRARENHPMRLGSDVTDGARAEALKALGRSGSRRALSTLGDTADAPEVASDARIEAMRGLLRMSGGRPRVLELARSDRPDVRSAAGVALIEIADDPAAWNAIATIAKTDPEPATRAEVTEYLSTSSDIPGPRVGDAIVLLRALAIGPDAPVAIAAARGLATFFHDTSGLARVMEIVADGANTDDVRASGIVALEYMKDPRAAPVLWRIVAMQYDPGSISLDGEDRLRGVADEALTKLFASRPDEYPVLYGHERSTVADIRRVIQEELAARATTSAFDPRLAGEGVRDGYTRRFVGGSESFAYIATPQIPMKTGVRAFCGDSTARICFTRNGSAPPVVDGHCPESDQPILTKIDIAGGIHVGPPLECGPTLSAR